MKKLFLILMFMMPMMAMAQSVGEKARTDSVVLGSASDYYKHKGREDKQNYYYKGKLFQRYVKTRDRLIKSYHFRQARTSYMEAMELIVRTLDHPDISALQQQIAICDRCIAQGLDADDGKD